jgi:hypothetical protein
MAKSGLYDIYISANHANYNYLGVVGHDILDLKGGTYHKITFVNGVVLLINDFGIHQVLITPSGVVPPTSG